MKLLIQISLLMLCPAEVLADTQTGGGWQTKDVVTTTLSVGAFAVAFYSLYLQSLRSERDLLAELNNCIEKLIEYRETREELRRELGDKLGGWEHKAALIALHDKKAFYLSRAKQIIDKGEVPISPWTYFMVAAAIADLGLSREAITYYQKAYSNERSPLERASISRALGRSRILAGSSDEGSADIENAADEFLRLSNLKGYDCQQLLYERAEAFRRLTLALLQVQDLGKAEKALKEFELAIAAIRDARRRESLEAAHRELFNLVKPTG